MATLSQDDQNAWVLVSKDYEMALETQRHFNDLLIRFRTIGFTSIGVFISGGIAAFSLNPLLACAIFGVSFILLRTFRDFDRNYYHKLLLGAVKKTKEIDEQYGDVTLHFMGQDTRLFGLAEYITNSVRSSATQDAEGHSSTGLIDRFYRRTCWALVILTALSLGRFGYTVIDDRSDSTERSESVWHSTGELLIDSTVTTFSIEVKVDEE